MIANATARPATDPLMVGECRVALAYGDPDDHLQIVASLAWQLAPTSERATPCWDPTAAWVDRVAAFRDVALKASHPVAIFDPDALDVAPTEAERWDDAFFLGQRSAFLTDLIEIGRLQGWTFLRPCPTINLSENLRARGFRDEPRSTMDEERPPPERLLLNSLAPEIRVMATYLLEVGALEQSTLRRILEDEDAEASEDGITSAQVIANLAYDLLPSAARRQARDLAAMRRPELVNGTLGPFPWTTPRIADSSPEATIDRGLYDLLSKRGVLHTYASPAHGLQARMPRDMRTLLQRQAMVIDPDRHRRIHDQMARRVATSMEDRAERHYHAVRAENVELAVRDAPYANDIRTIAYQWSHEKHYAEAAELYRRIITEFDDEDAYAWEYYAWNLARQRPSDAPRPSEASEEILAAYRRAHQLEADNPLFHGRWLGFRAELGEDVVDEFIQGLHQYTTPGYRVSVPWFAEAVIKGWRRGAGRAAYDEWRAVERVGPWLMNYPRLRDLLDEER